MSALYIFLGLAAYAAIGVGFAAGVSSTVDKNPAAKVHLERSGGVLVMATFWPFFLIAYWATYLVRS